MDHKKKELLQHYQKDIVTDLDVIYILDELFTHSAISTDDFDVLSQIPNRADKTRYFLDRLIQTGNNQAYETFVDSLQKDHRWLWEKFRVDEMKTVVLNNSFEDSLSRGDVPRRPDHYVERVTLENEVTEKLKTLTRHKILVLHGMSGSGKSLVAIGALRNNPDLITGNFNGVVFWINLGNVKTDDDLVMQQTKLMRKATSMYTQKDCSYMNSSVSSIGSNADSQSVTSSDFSWQEFRDILKTTFSEQALKEALIVLDEVNEKKCVEAFDIGCKMLITTRDTEVVSSFNPQIIRVNNSLQEKETLQLFASCLDVRVESLPRQARKLHEICKGSPFHIALIGAQLAENRERLIHDVKHWNYYIDKLAKKDFFILSRHPEKPIKTIEVCINSLPLEIMPLFKMLAILPENVMVSSSVLSKLWDKQTNEVESIMKTLRSKSLIIETYDMELKNYTYEVHDLIMNYLRSCFTEEEMNKLHADFLKSYGYEAVADNFVLEDDRYIPFYIGHHIYHTKDYNGMWGLFKIYLNLKFLGKKVRLTGTADVIMDLQKYEQYIATDELDMELILHIKSYLGAHGNDLYRYPCTDIVQSILQHESKGLLYMKANQIASENCAKNELYFKLSHEYNVDEIKHSTIDVKENIRSVCFLGDYVLVGTNTGVIKVFHIYTNKLKKELPRMMEPIRWVGTCPSNAFIIAAITGDGTVMIWYMDELDTDVSDDTIEEEDDESLYNGNFTPITIPPKLGPYVNCCWLNNKAALMAHTTKMIMVYETDGRLHTVIDIDREKQIINCKPSEDDKYVIAASSCNNVHYVEVFDARTKQKVLSVEESIKIADILIVPNTSKVLVLSKTCINEHVFEAPVSYNQTVFKAVKQQRLILSSDVKKDMSFITAVVNRGGSLLFVSTDDCRIICVDLKTNNYVFHLDNPRGNVTSMATSEMWYDDFVPAYDVLLTGNGSIENSVKVWYMDNAYVTQATQKHRKVRLTTKFDVSFRHTQSPQTPGYSTPPSETQSMNSTPRRIQSFDTHKQFEKKPLKKNLSLDRHSLKPLNLKGICNGNDEGVQPLLAVVDDKNNIQIIRGKKVLTEIPARSDDKVNAVKISPCNQFVIFGLQSGTVKKYFLRSKETVNIMDIYSPVQYLKFVNSNLLIVAGKNRCLMAYKFCANGEWKLEMLQKGSMNLGSQEILNDLQGVSKSKKPSDSISYSGSETSISSMKDKDRLFPSDTRPRLCRESFLVECFWVLGVGMITVENNATVKLWSEELKLISILYGRQTDVYVNCAAYHKNILAICDDYGRFLTFELREAQGMMLHKIHECKLNSKVVSCDLSADGNILAMGLETGEVVVWNVPGKCQLYYLRHHKARVQTCLFSPVPDRRRSHNAMFSPLSPQSSTQYDEEQPPLVLVTMASEIVWWNISYLMKIRASNKNWGRRVNVLTPLPSPIDNRSELTGAMGDLSLNKTNFFFGDGLCTPYQCWMDLWKKKTYKEGSKRKEILACIKLSGMNAKKLCVDENYSCFVTVDNPGHIHIMSVMKPNGS